MLVGPAMSGKSTLLNALLEASNQLHEAGKQDPDLEQYNRVLSSTFNPKSISIEELYGNFDSVTQTWSDGLASKLLRQYTQRLEQDHQFWVIFDGPVDSFWVENMNSVLDDSMILCLSNGERIKLHMRMRIIFETYNLSQASPATISRCGMIYVGHHVVQPLDLLQTFLSLADLKDDVRTYFKAKLEVIIPRILEFLKDKEQPIYTNQQVKD